MSRPLIVGIDPGTTCGWAFLDVQGQVLEVGSSKEMGLSSLITRAKDYGIPVIVGSDKGNTPDFVKQFSVKTGAKLVTLKNDVVVEDKRELTRNLSTENTHEMDALASSLIAYKKHRVLLKKIGKFAKAKNRRQLENEIIFLVITKGISMDMALRILEKPDEEVEMVKRVADGHKYNKAKLFEKYYWAVEENSFLRKEVDELKDALKREKDEKKRLNEMLRNTPLSTPAQKRRESKELHGLRRELKKSNSMRKRAEKELDSINEILEEIEEYIVCKRINRLTWQDLGDSKVKEDEVIFVDDPSSFSPNVVEFLNKRNVKVLAYRAGRALAHKITVIGAEGINIKNTGRFTFVKSEDFFNAFDQHNVLKRVVNEYRSEREKEEAWNSPE